MVEADDTLVFFAGAHDQDGAGAGGGDGDFVAGQDGDAPPCRDGVALYLDALGVDSPAVALATKRRDGLGMREEEMGPAPPAEKLVEVVGGGWAGAGVDALFEVGVVE